MGEGQKPINDVWQLRDGFFCSTASTMTWVIAVGSPLVLLLEALGGSALQVGLTYSFFFLLSPVQILATALLPRLGFRRQMGLAWAFRGVALMVPIGLALYGPAEPMAWMATAVVVAIFVFSLFSSVGSCVYSVWIYALLPDRLRGRYFSTDAVMVGITGMLTLFCCAWINATMNSFPAFSAQFILAGISAIFAVYFISRMPDATPPKPIAISKILRRAPQLILTPGHYRKFLILWSLGAIVGTPFLPFAIYFLKTEAAMADAKILIYTSFQYAGLIIGSTLIRTLVDRFSVRLFFTVALAGNITIYLLWAAFIPGWLPSQLIGLSFFAAGIAQANWYAAQMKYLPQLSSEEERPISVAVLVATISFIAGIAPIAWGLVLRGQTDIPSMNVDNFLIYFLVAAIVNLCLIPFFARLVELRPDVEPFYNPAWMSRPFRFIASLPHLVTSASIHNIRNEKRKNRNR